MTRLARHPAIIFITMLVIPIAGALISELVMFDLPGNEVQQLVAFMTITGVSSSLLSWGLYRLGVLEWFRSLRWAIWMVIALLVLMIFLNVWVIARFTFIQMHYLALTSLLLVFAGLSALSIGFFASRSMTERLSRLRDATGALAERDFSVRLNISGNDEIAQLADTFNDMAQKLGEVEAQKAELERTRRNLTAWVSHDLRTPLASLRVMIEAMQDGVVSDPATTQRYLSQSRAEIEHLTALIDDLFALAQLDVGHLRLNWQRASLRDLISDTLGSLDAQSRQAGITMEGQVADDVDVVRMAPDKIQRALSNLLDNAIKYSANGASVTLRAWRAGDDIRMDIHNSGSHIPPEALPRLFDSFYRGEGSRAQARDGERGTGLGLAIARGFIEAHGGHIQAASGENGTTFSVTLPQGELIPPSVPPSGRGEVRRP